MQEFIANRWSRHFHVSEMVRFLAQAAKATGRRAMRSYCEREPTMVSVWILASWRERRWEKEKPLSFLIAITNGQAKHLDYETVASEKGIVQPLISDEQ